MNEFDPRIRAFDVASEYEAAKYRRKIKDLEDRLKMVESKIDDSTKPPPGGVDSAGRRIGAFYLGEEALQSMGGVRVLQEAVAALLDHHTQPFYRRRLADELRRRVDSKE